MDPPPKTLTLTIPNGSLKKQQPTIIYRECLKNHAASLGGHSLDGCGEFMPSPSSDPTIPSSLTCAACSCHRNFHRRLPLHNPPHNPPPDSSDYDSDEPPNLHDNNDSNHGPHMLMALASAGGGVGGGGPTPPLATPSSSSRKRFRTRFSADQKEGMLRLSEQLGWRMQKRDDQLVEDKCREIGVGRGVFKVWMHNNKHNFVPSPRPVTAASPSVVVMPAVVPASSAGDHDDGRVNGAGSGMEYHKNNNNNNNDSSS